MIRFIKQSSEVERLMRQLGGHEKSIQDAFTAFVKTVKSDVVLKQVNALLAAGDIEGALTIVDSHIIRLAGTLTSTFTEAGYRHQQS